MSEQAVNFVWSLALNAPAMKSREQDRFTTERQILMAVAEVSDTMGCSQISAARIAKAVGKRTRYVRQHLDRMEHEGRIKVHRPFKLNDAGEPIGNKTVSIVCGAKVYRLGGPHGNVIQIAGINK